MEELFKIEIYQAQLEQLTVILLPKGRFPIFCLFIDVPGDFIDVNVHPGKTEIRFQDNALIRSLIVGSISRELNINFSQTTKEISQEAIDRFDSSKIQIKCFCILNLF